MSGTYYCHECEARRPMIRTPIETCSICSCHYIEEIPIVLEDNDITDEEEEQDFDRELDFFFIHEREEEDMDHEELLEERCLYEQLSNIYNDNHAIDLDNSEPGDSSSFPSQQQSSNNMSSSAYYHRHTGQQLPSLASLALPQPSIEQEQPDEQRYQGEASDEDDEIIGYDVLFEQTRPTASTTSGAGTGTIYNRDQQESTTTSSIFQLPFARFGRFLDTMYSYSDDEEEEEGGSHNDYYRRSFLDNLADILSDYTQDINALGRSAATWPTGPSMEVILNSLKKAYLTANDPDVQDECIICQDVYGTSLEIFYLPCHHKFHGDCISQWLNMNASCPICRRPAHHDIKTEEEEEEEEEEVITTSTSLTILPNPLWSLFRDGGEELRNHHARGPTEDNDALERRSRRRESGPTARRDNIIYSDQPQQQQSISDNEEPSQNRLLLQPIEEYLDEYLREAHQRIFEDTVEVSRRQSQRDFEEWFDIHYERFLNPRHPNNRTASSNRSVSSYNSNNGAAVDVANDDLMMMDWTPTAVTTSMEDVD